MLSSLGALAAVPPSTAYQFSSHPMISGSVVTVNDHQMVVNTDQGEQVTLQMDSRTMAPLDLSPGMVMRAEFEAQEDCRFFARRIIPVRYGTSTDRTQAYAVTHDSPEAIAKSTSMPMAEQHPHNSMRAEATTAEAAPQAASSSSAGEVMAATPGSSDAWFSSRPMISGRVMMINDHRLVVETEQGQRVGMVMDSRTMVPSEVASGTMIRAEFRQMNDGRYYANRIAAVDPGSAVREQAYAHTRDSDLDVARNSEDCGFTSTSSGSAASSALEPRKATPSRQPTEAGNAPIAAVVSHEPIAPRAEPAPAAERPRLLPQTGSSQPLLLMLGLLALGSAGVIAVVRGLRTA